MNQHSNIYAFDDFRFDAGKHALYYKNNLVKTVDRKTMQVLAVLLLHPNKLTTQDEIIETVWQDNPHGVTSNHIGQYISRLRKIFAEFVSEKNYIETARGRGYSFVGDVSLVAADDETKIEESASEYLPALPEAVEFSVVEKHIAPSRKFSRLALLAPLLILVLPAAFFGWKWISNKNDEDEIRRVVKESQLYESLVLYRNPAAFRETDLDKYWTSELDFAELGLNVNYDRRRISEAVKKLNDEGRRYGDETKCERFEFQSVEINQDGDYAVVKTLEKWFITVYTNDDTSRKNKTVGPYFVSYILRKVDGRWLIEKSTTARINRPTPRLSDIRTTSEAKPKQQFFVKITGQDFEPETVFLEVSGEGCPESQPCKVPNTTLRENSKMSETTLENVPLTLASGKFRIVVRNGNSPASNPLDLTVP